jgi:Protein of unknown function (DUF2721)
MWNNLDFMVPVTDVAHAIQLSLGPVFLLNGLGVLLAMLTSRLARIVDRARALESRLPNADEDEAAEITLGTMAALLVSLVVVLLFATAFVKYPFGATIALVFIGAMLALVGALWCFLIEVRVATAALRFGPGKNGK